MTAVAVINSSFIFVSFFSLVLTRVRLRHVPGSVLSSLLCSVPLLYPVARSLCWFCPFDLYAVAPAVRWVTFGSQPSDSLVVRLGIGENWDSFSCSSTYDSSSGNRMLKDILRLL